MKSPKSFLFILGIIVLTLTCSPFLAMSKGDLISHYKEHMGSTWDSSSSMTFDQMMENKPAKVPKFMPTPQPPSLPFPKWANSSFFKPVQKPVIPTSPLVKPGIRSGYVTCPPFLPIGKLHILMVYCSCFREEMDTCDCVNPKTGEHYPFATDDMGTMFLVKEGCPCTWAE